MGILDFNTTTANSTSMLPGQTGPVPPTTPSFVLPPVPAATTTPTVNVNLATPSPAIPPTSQSAPTTQTPATPTTPTVEQTQANANFRSSLNSAVNSGNPTPASVLSSGATPTTAISSADKYYQDYLKQQKDFQDQVLANMKPGAEETALRQKLTEQKTQAALNQETALNSGETSSFAGGEAQRVARTDAIKTAGLEAQVQTLQDTRKNAVDALQVLLNSGDKSFDALTKIETLKNTVNGIDKQSQDTFFNLQQANPTIDYTYDKALTPTENLSAFRAKVAEKQTIAKSYQTDPEVSALVNLGLISGGTEAERATRANQIAGLPDAQRKEAIKSLAVGSLTTAQQGSYQSNQLASSIADQALSSMDTDLVNNPYKYLANDYTTYLGGKKDPKYSTFMQFVQSVNAPIRQGFFGASLTEGEQKAANQFLPDPAKDDIKTLVIKLRNVKSIAEYTNDVMLANKLGLPKPNLERYISINTDGTARAQGPKGEYYKNTDEAAKAWGYSQEEINAHKSQSSFSKVGNTTASVTIPKTSNLAYVNNNPGNLRFAGQAGASQGQGGFAKFDSPEAGVKALNNQVALDASRGHTLASFINKYAPPTENNTSQYLSQAIANLGVNKDTPLSKIPTDKLVKFIALKESSTKIS